MRKSRLRIISAILATAGLLAIANDPGVAPVPTPVPTGPAPPDSVVDPRTAATRTGVPTRRVFAQRVPKNLD